MDEFSVPCFLFVRSLLDRLLLPLLSSCLLARQSLANATRGTANALVRFLFRNVGGVTFCRSNVMFGDTDPNMRGALLVAERAAHRRGTQTLPARALVDECLGDEELLDIERSTGVFGLLFRVGNGAAENFFDVLGCTLWREAKRFERILHFLAADQI